MSSSLPPAWKRTHCERPLSVVSSVQICQCYFARWICGNCANHRTLALLKWVQHICGRKRARRRLRCSLCCCKSFQQQPGNRSKRLTAIGAGKWKRLPAKTPRTASTRKMSTTPPKNTVGTEQDSNRIWAITRKIRKSPKWKAGNHRLPAKQGIVTFLLYFRKLPIPVASWERALSW